ncbi:MAG: rod shape-determining protein MreD [Flavobacteriaceae bacterium]|nr:rod shape-determining protein MreD [Flavobacteriaceae bacterium]
MNEVIRNSIAFVLLVLLQVLVFNNIALFGYINPMPYVLWLLLFPLKKDKIIYLLGAFFIGLTIDFFSNSGGIQAMASVFIAYIRLSVLKLLYQKKEVDFSSFTVRTMPTLKLIYFTVILVLIHHFIVFCFEFFDLSRIGSIIKYTFATSLFTLFLCMIGISLFVKRNQ